MPNSTRITSQSLYRAIVLAAALYAFILGFSVLAPILFSILLILTISLALNPLVYRIRRLFGGRKLATALVVLGFIVVLVLTSYGFYSPVKRAGGAFAKQIPEYIEKIQRPLLKMERRAAVSQERIKEEVTQEVIQEESNREGAVPPPPPPSEESTAPQEPGLFQSGVSNILGGLAAGFQSIAVNIATLVVILVTVLAGVIFTLISPHRVVSVLFALVPEQQHDTARRIASRIAYVIPRWAVAMLIGMAVVGVLVFLAMWPVFGLEEALLLGVIAAVFEIVPYVGPFLAVLPALLLAMGEGGSTPAIVIGCYAVIQLIESHVISPVVVGGRLHLHPLAVILSILLCVTIFGVVAVLIAIPMIAVVRILHEELYRPRFLPNVSGDDLIALSRSALNEKPRQGSDQK